MITRTKFTPRTYAGESDLQAVCDLLNVCDAHDKLDDNYSVEDLKIEFQDPRLDTSRDLRLWEDAEERLVGFGQIWLPRVGDSETVDGGGYIRIHPEARNQGLESEIVEWLESRAREVGQERGQKAEVKLWTHDFDAYGRGIAESHGYEPVRYFFLMHRPLNEPLPESQLPEGFTLRHVQSQEDRAEWVEAFNLSFIDHWNFHPSSLEIHNNWLQSSKYMPERDLVAVAPDGKTFAAFCFCWIDPDDNERNNRNEGWIDTLGTRRGFRKMGLGRAMLLAGMRKLTEDGVDIAKLGVDAENPTGALRLYESVGFKTVRTSVSFRKEL
jgi:mycothiol synthase